MIREAGCLLLLIAAALSGCGGDDKPAAASTPAACVQHVPKKPVKPPEGLLTPKGITVVVKSVTGQGTDLTVEGYTPMTPQGFNYQIDVSSYVTGFRELDATDTEVMYSQGKWRNFWVLRSVCPGGSQFFTQISLVPPPG